MTGANRRAFLHNSVLAGGAVAFAGQALVGRATKPLAARASQPTAASPRANDLSPAARVPMVT